MCGRLSGDYGKVYMAKHKRQDKLHEDRAHNCTSGRILLVWVHSSSARGKRLENAAVCLNFDREIELISQQVTVQTFYR